MELFRDLGERSPQAYALNELGLVQQVTGNHPAAAVSHHQALQLFRDIGERHGQADVLNSLGELSSRTAESQRARDYHSQALAIARELGGPLEEARALEGIGHRPLTLTGAASSRQDRGLRAAEVTNVSSGLRFDDARKRPALAFVQLGRRA